MNKKLSTLGAGFAAAVVSAATFAPMALAESAIKLTYDKTMGTVSAEYKDGGFIPYTIIPKDDTVTFKITPKDDYKCAKVSAGYIGTITGLDIPIKGLTCDNTSFDVAGDTKAKNVHIEVTFAKKEYAISVKSNDESMGTVAVDGDLTKSVAGERIFIDATPINENYQVTWKSEDVEIDYPTHLGASFEMPKKDVSVTAVFEKLAITKGENQGWIQGSEEGLTVVGNGHFEKFKKGGYILVDGNILGEENFVAEEEDGTKITLTPKFLATLNTGKHSLVLAWDSGLSKKGSAETTFSILATKPEEKPEEETKQEVKKEERTVAPDTGVSSAATLFAAASTLTLGGALVAKRANKA